MPHAIRIHEPGGPEVLTWEAVDVPAPGPGEIAVTHKAVGLNYIDVYHRTGLYPAPLPFTPGLEAAGVVDAVGDGVTDLKPGDRIAYADVPLGAYAEARVMPAHRAVKLPDAIDFETGASMMLQGMTAEYLLRRTYQVKPGDTILVHAAAGGVGLILCQWAKALGATVIGTVGSEEKAALAKANGCDHPILYREVDFVAAVKEITGGKGLPVVYDSVGVDTYMGSMECLAPRGLLVLYGQASGPVPPLDLGLLAKMGSLYVTRPTLMVYNAPREELVTCAAGLFDVVTSGKVKITVNQRFPLREAAEAHRQLEARKTTGSTVFTLD